ncbi:MAG: hypothetical protein ACK559_33080, partial [bacterium]
EGAEGLDVDQVDVGGLLGLVGGGDDPRGGLRLEDEEALAGDQHHPLPVPVDQLGLVGLHRADDLIADHARPEALVEPQPEELEHRVAGAADLALVVVVDLEQPVGALDHLHRGGDAGGLQRDVGDA